MQTGMTYTSGYGWPFVGWRLLAGAVVFWKLFTGPFVKLV